MCEISSIFFCMASLLWQAGCPLDSQGGCHAGTLQSTVFPSLKLDGLKFHPYIIMSNSKIKETADPHLSNKPAPWQTLLATIIITSAFTCLVAVALTANWTNNESIWNLIKIPRTVGDAKQIGALILKYKQDNYYSVFGVYFATYILLQSLCIPGSIVLSILAGYLFPAPLALFIICTCSTLGASTFYILIYNYKQTLIKFLSRGSDSRVDTFNKFVQAKVQKYKSNLYICVFILRATPIFPNWSINLFSPLINLPLRPFVWGTFTGVAPLSVIHVWTGRMLNDLSNDQSLVNWQSILMTSLLAVSIGLLVYIKRIA